MLNEPPDEVLASLPRFNETEEVECDEKIIQMHFFMGRYNWYVAEYDGEDLFFGYVNLGDPMNAEWGYFSLSELKDLSAGVMLRLEADGETADFEIGQAVEWNEHWQPIRFGDLHEGDFI